MRPENAQVLSENIVIGYRGRLKDVAGPAEDVASVVKGYDPDEVGYWNAGLKVYDRKGVAAERNGEWIQGHGFAVAVPELAFGYYHNPGPGGFEFEAAQRIRTAGKKAFADRQNALEVRELVGRESLTLRKDACKAENAPGGECCVLEPGYRVITLVCSLEFMEADVCTKQRRRNVVFSRKESAVGGVAGIIAAGVAGPPAGDDVKYGVFDPAALPCVTHKGAAEP